MADPRPKLLVIEDDKGLQRQLRWAYDNYQLLVAADRAEAIAIFRAECPAVVTLDLGLPPDPDGVAEGMTTLRDILAHSPSTKVIVASGHGDRSSARQAIAEGAWDFYQKPIDFDSLGHIVARAFHVHALEAENRRLTHTASVPVPTGLGRIISADSEMLKLVRMGERIADTNVSVMLRGDSGTGKELFAFGLHETSGKADRAFVSINCAAIPEALLEAELFGHEAGSTPGKLELADGGTLFLDEVSAMSLTLQARLLGFLEARKVERLEGRKAIPVDVRILCATSQDLEAMIAEGRFRDDLYYALAEIVIRIPALGSRAGDAVLLARHFVLHHAPALNPQVRDLTPDAAAAVDAWAWPGNVREVENRVKRALVLAEGRHLTVSDLDLAAAVPDAADDGIDLKSAREQTDRIVIRRALARSDGNISAAARALGVSRPTLYELIKTYDLQGPPS